jgi:hypothetical protein
LGIKNFPLTTKFRSLALRFASEGAKGVVNNYAQTADEIMIKELPECLFTHTAPEYFYKERVYPLVSIIRIYFHLFVA